LVTDKKTAYSKYGSDSISRTYTINKTDSISTKQSVGIIETDSLSNSQTLYIITENGGEKSITVKKTSELNENVFDLEGSVVIDINEKTGETTFTIDGKEYSEEELKKLKEIGTQGFEMISINKQEDGEYVKKRHKESIVEMQERRLKAQEMRRMSLSPSKEQHHRIIRCMNCSSPHA